MNDAPQNHHVVSPQGEKSHRPKRMLELDALRGLAAIAVVACHYLSELKELGRIDFEFRLGSYGAHLFFIISGFVIYLTMERCRHPFDFAFARFSRLYPVYWFCVLFSASLVCIGAAHFPYFELTPTQLLCNLTMGQTWLGIEHLEFSYWTLGVELKFYGLMFALLLLRKERRIETFLIGWLVSVLAFRTFDYAIGLPNILSVILLLDYAHLFAAGIMLYRLKKHGHSWLRHSIIVGAIPMQLLAGDVESMILIAAFLVTFYLFIANRLSWIAIRPMAFLGDISYPLYLIHGTIGIVAMQSLHKADAPLFVMLAIPVLLSLTIATWISKNIDKPSLLCLRNWYQHKKPGLQLQPFFSATRHRT